MQGISRRGFLGAAAAATALRADPLGIPIGFQSYSLRSRIESDFQGMLREMAEVGYRRVELCSPFGYEKSGCGALQKMKPEEIRRTIKDAGLGCESSHYSFKELQDSLAERIDYAKALG